MYPAAPQAMYISNYCRIVYFYRNICYINIVINYSSVVNSLENSFQKCIRLRRRQCISSGELPGQRIEYI